jgi:hypothetical protein
MSSVLDDADHVGDALYIAAVESASSSAEQAFRDVLLFHRDLLNGGFSQAIDNNSDDLSRFVSAFEQVGLAPVAAIIQLAHGLVVAVQAREQFPEDELDALTGLYVAAAYNLAYVGAGYRSDPDFPIESTGDQVERIALRYARNNVAAFAAVIGAAEGKFKPA